MTDREIINQLKIGPKDKVLDIGGSLKQHEEIKIDTLVDVYHPSKAPYWPAKLRAKHFVKVDVTRQKLPFANKSFDVCLCTHTLEDLYNPFLVLEEMARVAKRGLVVTPSQGNDMVFSHFNLTDWLTGARRQPGLSHHHWFFENKENKLIITPKIYPILYTSQFFVTSWYGQEECQYFWQKKIDFEVFPSVDTHAIIKNYRQFLKDNKDKIQKGLVLLYLDNPYFIFKEWAKFFWSRWF